MYSVHLVIAIRANMMLICSVWMYLFLQVLFLIKTFGGNKQHVLRVSFVFVSINSHIRTILITIIIINNNIIANVITAR